MGADPIIYCLEQVTDYDAFERLSSDLMVAQGYANLEPLGGTSDKGRDAIQRGRGPSESDVVFAYSVREDWKQKLQKDCASVKKHGHKCDELVFVTTSRVSATERDQAMEEIKSECGWRLELFSIERLRILLVTNQQILAQHPAIFGPPFFLRAGGLTVAPARDTVLVDAVPVDFALAGWLARRLALQGYRVWSATTAPLVGESEHETISTLIATRAARVVSILSSASLADADMGARRSQAVQAGILLPATSEPIDDTALDSKTRGLTPAKFEQGLPSGLRDVVQALENAGVEKGPVTTTLDYRVFAAADVLLHKPERLYANQFPIIESPTTILRFRASDRALGQDWAAAEQSWAFRRVEKSFLSFSQPPDQLRESLGLRPEGGATTPWPRDIDGIRTWDLRAELIKKTLRVHAIASGLLWCATKEEVYFPHEERFERFTFEMPDGSKTWLKCWGERSYWRPAGSETYRYSLVPEFGLAALEGNDLRMELRIRIRITDDKGQLLSDRRALSRRKQLSSGWFNDEWFKRTIAVARFIAAGGDAIDLTAKGIALRIKGVPISYDAPASIDEDHLKDFAALRKEALDADRDEDDEDDE